jgi:hypothetical protein
VTSIVLEFLVDAEDGAPLDACVELEVSAIVLQSRGGTKGLDGTRNQDYSRALRLILSRLHGGRRSIVGAWVDSSRVQSLALSERQILSETDLPVDPAKAFSMMGRRMESVGQTPNADPSKGNRSKRIRIALSGGSVGEIAAIIQARPKPGVPRSALRLPTADLNRVTAAHIWNAAEALAAGSAEHRFGGSADFELIVDGIRLPPKAVFGFAASEALGFSVGPEHFSSGAGKPAFDLLTAAGFVIVPKGQISDELSENPLSYDDRDWAEGNPRLRRHLGRERARGLAQAKKAAFIIEHGHLFCERCFMDPAAVFGDADGTACIEVHHNETQVSEMTSGHRTRLVDVQCLCANCHRYVHRLLKRALSDQKGGK